MYSSFTYDIIPPFQGLKNHIIALYIVRIKGSNASGQSVHTRHHAEPKALIRIYYLIPLRLFLFIYTSGASIKQILSNNN